MLSHVLAPSSTVFLFPSTKILISSIFSNVGVPIPMLLTHRRILKDENEIFIRRHQTFLLFESEVGESVGSGMKLAMIAKKITPPKNCHHNQ